MGSGIGLAALWGVRHLISRARNKNSSYTYISATDFPWFLGAIVAGGAIGPFLLMQGLSVIPAATASLMLNLEGVFTAALAWWVFNENFDRRILFGMMFIVAASILLAFQPIADIGPIWGLTAITGACLCWAIDNNLTRKVSANDAVQIACLKGLFAGTCNLILATATGTKWPNITQSMQALTVGFMGYGLSLVCFVLALRYLGTARTGAYFSVAPFVGAILALSLGEHASAWFWIGFGLMVVGIGLHLTEKHEHIHEHEPILHIHTHVHDEHHQHSHDFQWNGQEPHAHEHHHPPMKHSHPHFPDIHHSHKH